MGKLELESVVGIKLRSTIKLKRYLFRLHNDCDLYLTGQSLLVLQVAWRSSFHSYVCSPPNVKTQSLQCEHNLKLLHYPEH